MRHESLADISALPLCLCRFSRAQYFVRHQAGALSEEHNTVDLFLYCATQGGPKYPQRKVYSAKLYPLLLTTRFARTPHK
jgi:hypothetical protein